MTTTERNLIEITNNNIANWYDAAKEDFNVNGFGSASIQGDEFVVNYTENGVENKWSMYYHESYISENGLNWFYNVWCEEAGR